MDGSECFITGEIREDEDRVGNILSIAFWGCFLVSIVMLSVANILLHVFGRGADDVLMMSTAVIGIITLFISLLIGWCKR